MADKTKSVNIKHVPKDAQVIMSIIKDMGITDYEPKVINQLLEFTYRYITCILDDSKIYANHAKKKFIDIEDVRLAVKMQLERSFTNPPPRDVLLEVARAKNNIPLPFVKPNNGLRLPPDRFCLNAANHRLKDAEKKTINKPMIGINSIGGRNKIDGKSSSIVKRPGGLSTVARTQSISVPKPLFKFSTGGTAAGTTSSSAAITTTTNKPKPPVVTTNQPVKMEIDENMKRKRDDDDDYDLP